MRAPHPLTYAYLTESYAGNPTNSPGTSVVGGYSNADGTAVALIGTPLTHDVQLLDVIISAAVSNVTSTVDSSQIMDLLIDPAGGTAWDTTNVFIEGLLCGYLPAQVHSNGNVTARRWRFPIFIPAGATIAGRSRSIQAASGPVTVEVSLKAWGGPNRPVWYGQKVDAIGINRASSGGTAISTNASPSTYNSFASFGSVTARRYGALLPYATPIGSQSSSASAQLQLGIGSVQISPTYNYGASSAETASPFNEDNLIYRDIPEGTQLQYRFRSTASTAQNQQMIIHGVS